jgi:hypothetical protein
MMRLLRRDEPVAAHRVVPSVKKAMARANTSISPERPGSQSKRDCYARSAIDLPDWRTNATVSALNSLVSRRLERLSIEAD